MYTFERTGNYVIVKKNGVFYDNLPAVFVVRKVNSVGVSIHSIERNSQYEYTAIPIVEINGADCEPPFIISDMESCIMGLMKIFVGESTNSNNANTYPLWDDPQLTSLNDTMSQFLGFINNQ